MLKKILIILEALIVAIILSSIVAVGLFLIMF